MDTYLAALKAGAKPQQIHMGCIHVEPRGVLALDQKGGGKNLAQTRLYLYPDPENETIFLITLGGKDTQPDDLQLCGEFVAKLREEKEKEKKPEERKVPDTS